MIAAPNPRFQVSYSWVVSLVALVFMFALCSTSAEIKLTDDLSISGFLDMSSKTTTGGDDTEIGFSFDQFELDFHLDQDSVTGRVDLHSSPGEHGNTGIKLEQAYVTYALPESTVSGVSIKAGRFLSALGFESDEPTGLYQYSLSEGSPYPVYQNGIGVDINPTKQLGIYVALLSGVWDVNDTDIKDPGFEAQLALTPTEQITAKVGYAMDKMEDFSQSELNAWAQFTQGPLTLAGEFDLLQNWGHEGENGIHYLGMANVSLADMIGAPVGVTLRFSGISLDEGEEDDGHGHAAPAADEDGESSSSNEFTLSPSYSVTDNWLILAEFKQRIDKEETIIAVESLFTF
ncbi:MAG: outer membrane beta-barrel protein [Candidatus Poribacteria bacterium]|nr:outer membrane beta-barrel protein [Candidatus Poribacteria bacterium]